VNTGLIQAMRIHQKYRRSVRDGVSSIPGVSQPGTGAELTRQVFADLRRCLPSRGEKAGIKNIPRMPELARGIAIGSTETKTNWICPRADRIPGDVVATAGEHPQGRDRRPGNG